MMVKKMMVKNLRSRNYLIEALVVYGRCSMAHITILLLLTSALQVMWPIASKATNTSYFDNSMDIWRSGLYESFLRRGAIHFSILDTHEPIKSSSCHTPFHQGRRQAHAYTTYRTSPYINFWRYQFKVLGWRQTQCMDKGYRRILSYSIFPSVFVSFCYISLSQGQSWLWSWSSSFYSMGSGSFGIT